MRRLLWLLIPVIVLAAVWTPSIMPDYGVARRGWFYGAYNTDSLCWPIARLRLTFLTRNGKADSCKMADSAKAVRGGSGTTDSFKMGLWMLGRGGWSKGGDSTAVDTQAVLTAVRAITNPIQAGTGILLAETTGTLHISVDDTVIQRIAGSSSVSHTSEVDEFGDGLVASTSVGDLGWPVTGSIVEKAGEAGHPGIKTLSTTAITGAVAGLQRDYVYSTDVNHLSLLMRPLSGSTVMGFRFGLLDTQLTLETSKGIYFSFLAESSANWRTVTRDNDGITRHTSTTAYTPGSWYLLEIIKNGGSYEFWINGVLQFTHSTNVYAGSVRPMLFLVTRNAVAKSVDLDWYYCGTGTLAR